MTGTQDAAAPERYDLVVIGSGPAGENAAALAAYFGRRVLIVERQKPGGTVTTTGGAPTKTLREAASYVTGFYERDVYGLTVAAPPELALTTIAERTRRVCTLLQEVTASNIAQRGVDYLQGAARLGPQRSVLVTTPDGTERRLAAGIILIATGSRPLHPPTIPFDDPDVCDSEEIFRLGRVPRDLLIVGAGPIGVEYATIYTALQVSVTLVDRMERLLPQMDGELSRLMAQRFAQLGVRLIFGAELDTVERANGTLRVALSNGTVLHPDALCFAAGRRPHTEGLGLAEAGVRLDAHGRIVVNAHYQTDADGIYAAGDVLGPTLASIAMEQGIVAACHAFGVGLKEAVHPMAVSAVYGMPEVAGAGLTEEQCQAQGIAYEVGRSDLSVTPRGAIAGHGGLLKLIFRRDDRRLLGVHCIGDIASELVGIGQMVMHYEGAIDAFVALTLNTPTYSYAYKYAAFDGLRRLAGARGGGASAEVLELARSIGAR
jgi:NAD(P) transhydrogenase